MYKQSPVCTLLCATMEPRCPGDENIWLLSDFLTAKTVHWQKLVHVFPNRWLTNSELNDVCVQHKMMYFTGIFNFGTPYCLVCSRWDEEIKTVQCITNQHIQCMYFYNIHFEYLQETNWSLNWPLWHCLE